MENEEKVKFNLDGVEYVMDDLAPEAQYAASLCMQARDEAMMAKRQYELRMLQEDAMKKQLKNILTSQPQEEAQSE